VTRYAGRENYAKTNEAIVVSIDQIGLAVAAGGLIDHLSINAERTPNMLTRFLERLSLSTFVCLLVPATAGVAMAEPPGQAYEGKVEAIEIYRTSSDNAPLNTGTVVGGIAGGVIGHQIGSGRGNTAATIAGAIGGAVVGNEIEKRRAQPTRYRINVRLDSGSSLVVDEMRDLNLRVGDRVRVEDGRIYRV
jgi:outer membrane lipoprotein SlyB